ncbi:hypothetical protein FWH58_00235 [Candidatus Saccharibacteria bacterium]|nr:hypothetical protein [Candidatus Saccharibacteria bacterium]
MSLVVPTITAATPNEYASQLTRLDFAPRIHLDITDGEFAPSETINLNQVYWDNCHTRHSERNEESPQNSTDPTKSPISQNDRIVDLHLMIKRPIEWLHQIVALNPDLVILHAESDNAAENLPRIFAHLKEFGIKCGVAILPETAPEKVAEIIKEIDHVLVFGGRLGYQGGTADLKQLEKVAQIREILKQVQNDGCEIAWDGGANAENIAEIAAAGVDVINVGSAIARAPEPEKTYDTLVIAAKV